MSSPWQEWKNSLGDSRPWHLINKDNYTVDDEAKKRFDICKLCPEFIDLTTQCKKCGCIMSLKTKLKSAQCPIGKW